MLRQTPEGDGLCQDTQFVFSQKPIDGVDWLVVFDEPPADFVTSVPRSARLLIVTEPPGFKIYHSKYLNQFGSVLSPLVRPKGYRDFYRRQQSALPWFYGLPLGSSDEKEPMSWRDLVVGPQMEKTDKVSIICSTKSKLSAHRQRLRFIEVAQTIMGEQLDVYGRGFKPIEDKATAISSYKYHIVLENNDIEHFWTEKTADCLLGRSFMFFSGCENIGDYFPEGAYQTIDINKPMDAVRRIQKEVGSNVFSRSVSDIEEARDRLMNDFNIFAMCCDVIRSNNFNGLEGREGCDPQK